MKKRMRILLVSAAILLFLILAVTFCCAQYNVYELTPTICNFMLGSDVTPQSFVANQGQGTTIEFEYTYAKVNADGNLMLILSDSERDAWKNEMVILQILSRKWRDKKDIGVDIIEQEESRCLELSEALPRATVICGDGTDRDTLLEEGLQSSDACVVLTGIDEENIIVSLYAQSQGVGKVITKIDRISFLDMVESVGIDSFISPKEITANRIVRYVRSMQVSEESSMKTLYKIVSNQAEAIEFAISHDTSYTNIPIKDLKTKKGILFASIIRRGRVIIPGGDDHLEAGDSVIIVTSSGVIKNLEDVFI